MRWPWSRQPTARALAEAQEMRLWKGLRRSDDGEVVVAVNGMEDLIGNTQRRKSMHEEQEQFEERTPTPKRIKGPRGPQPQPVPGKKPGVGYTPLGLSYAGFDHGFMPVPFDLTVDLEGLDGMMYIEARAKMVAGGNVQQAQAGAPGTKPDQLGQILRRAWESRANFLNNPDDFDGIPTETEKQRAFYAQKGDAALNNFAAGIFARDNPPAVAPPAQPASGASLQGVENLTPVQFQAVQAMINVLIQKGGVE